VASTADFRNGMTIQIEGTLFTIVYFQHVKPGKGGAFVRTKLKNVLTGAVVEKTYRAGEKVQYSYTDGDLYYFMDQGTYEMIPLSKKVIGEDQLSYLKENMECEGLVHGDDMISVELPYFVELEIVETDPGVRGDTATGGTKPARLETGAVVQVPLFLEQGEVIRVDRREDKYIERVGR
jgi:elongation factor P